MPEDDLETAELKERIEQGVERALEAGAEGPRWMTYLSVSTAVIAVLAALASLESGSNSNDAILEKNGAVLYQARVSDQWAYYQAKSVKAALAATAADLTSDGRGELAAKFLEEAKRYKTEQDEIEKSAHELEAKVKESNERARGFLEVHHRFALSVTLFQVAIALSAVAALMRRKQLWFLALGASLGGVVVFSLGLASR